MKNILRFSIIAASAALALMACNKENENPVNNEQPAGGIKITVVADSPATKTELTGTNTIGWRTGDKIDFVNSAAGEKVASDEASISAGKATFTGTVTNTGTFYAYYPTSSRDLVNAHGEVKFSNEQSPAAADTFDPMADVMVSNTFEIDAAGSYDTDPATLTFKRLGAFLKVYFVDATTGSKLGGEYATSVAVQSDGTGKVQLVGKMEVAPSGIVNFVGQYYRVAANYADGVFDIDADNAYIGIYPATLANGSDLIITAETKKYSISKTITLTKDIVLGGGDVLPIRITLGDANLTPKLQFEKVWEKMSTSSVAWTTTLTDGVVSGTAGADFNIAIDGNYVYVPEFGSTKRIWAISVTDGSDVKLVNTSTVASSGFDGTVYMSCTNVVKKSDGTPILLATNVFADNNGKLYVWDNGIDNAPRVVTLNQYGAGRRLGDKFTTYGGYEDCWLLMGTQTGNGFVTFKVPTSGTSAVLISRLATTTTDFATYYPFPGDITNGMFAWHGGDHDDTGDFTYRNRKMTISSTESAIKTEGAHTSEVTKLSSWMSDYENNNGTGYNFIEFNGKRYVIWCVNRTNTKQFDLIVKQGTTETAWDTIINTSGSFKREKFVGEMATTWKNSANCAVWNDGTDVYIAINKQQVGIALYHMYMPD